MTSFLHSSRSKTKFALDNFQNFHKSLAFVFCFFTISYLFGQGEECNNAFDFRPDVGTYLEVNALAAPESFTFEAWVYQNSQAGVQRIIEFLVEAPVLQLNAGTPELDDGSSVVTGPAIAMNTWTHIAVTHDDATNTTRLFVNGVLVDTDLFSVTTTGSTFRVGEDFDGILDEVRVWNFARNQANILATMNDELTGFEAGLIVYYNFNDIDGPGVDDGSTQDISGNWNTGVVNGTTTWADGNLTISAICDYNFPPNGIICSASCNNHLQVSVEDNCEALITVDMVLEGVPEDPCSYGIKLKDPDTGLEVPNPVTGEYVGKKLTAIVTVTGSGTGNNGMPFNSCWGEIWIEDKIDPEIQCPPDTVVSCNSELVDPLDIILDVTITDNCDPDPEIIGLTDIVEKQDCTTGDTSAIQKVTFSAIDNSGRLSEPCMFRIIYQRKSLCDIETPQNIDGLGGNPGPLECSTPGHAYPFWDHNQNGYPDPFVDYNENGKFDWTDYNNNDVFDFWIDDGDGIFDEDDTFESNETETGVPLIDGIPIFPNDGFCEINATYTDQIIPICPNSYKVLRQWVILDWCYGSVACTSVSNPFYSFQIIKVLDDRPPIVTEPGDDCRIVSTNNPYECTADYEVPAPIAVFECGGWTWRVQYYAGVEPTMVHPTDDDCGCPDVGDVEDLFTEDGVVYSSGNGNADGLNPDDKVTITNLPNGCAWVRYILEDECGNVSSDTRFEIRVMDQVPPIPVCDEHTVVSLTSNNQARVWAKTFDDGSVDNCDDYELNFMVKRMGQSDAFFNDWIDFDCWDIPAETDDLMVVLKVTDSSWNTNTCMVSVRIDDKIPPHWVINPKDLDADLDCGEDTSIDSLGTPTAWDNCDDVTVTWLRDRGGLNECGTGIIFRDWEARDKAGTPIVGTQTITVINETPFDVTNSDWDIWLNPANKFDCNIQIQGCVGNDTSPDGAAGKPILDHEDDCSLVAYNYEDQVFNFAEDACFKIIRKWTIIDWCQYNPNAPSSSNPGLWTKVQIIKVYDFTPPVFGPGCMDVTINGNPNSCGGTVTLQVDVSDSCSKLEDISVSYEISFEGGGGTSGTGKTYSSSDVPVGRHTIIWTAEDGCGNISTCEGEFEVKDEKAPTPLCIGGITTVIMPSTGFVDIWAVDFNNGSYDNCCSSKPDCEDYLDFTARLHPSVPNSSRPLTPSLTFSCDDVGMHDVDIWVYDGQNSDYCTVKIFIQANGNSCPDAGNGSAMLAGLVQTEQNQSVEDVMVKLENYELEIEEYYMTKGDGQYEFSEVLANTEFMISASRDDDYLNGVSTIDLVMMQRHILGIAPFESALDLLAADINNNQTVSASDMVDLRKLILGVIDDLPNNSSWRFVDKKQQFANLIHPWPFTEVIEIEGIFEPDMDNDFVAVKIGDVSDNAVPNKATSVEVRTSQNDLVLKIEEKSFETNEYLRIPVSLGESTILSGMQFTINFDPEVLNFTAIQSGVIDVTNENLGLRMEDSGLITLSWNQAEGIELSETDQLFVIEFNSTAPARLSDVIALSSDITSAEAYGKDLEYMNVDLGFQTDQLDQTKFGRDFELYQNEPNPFSEQTTIKFYLPEANNIVLTVFDITGKKLLQIDQNFASGLNEVRIDKSQLRASGVLYYQVDVDGFRDTKKMIFLE